MLCIIWSSGDSISSLPILADFVEELSTYTHINPPAATEGRTESRQVGTRPPGSSASALSIFMHPSIHSKALLVELWCSFCQFVTRERTISQFSSGDSKIRGNKSRWGKRKKKVVKVMSLVLLKMDRA